MSMIERYKKKGGFVQLLTLLETTGSEKREKFLKMIAEENSTWESEIKKKMLTIDRICSWNQSYLMEIFPRIPVQNMAAIVCALPAEKQQIFIEALAYSDRKKVSDLVQERKPLPGEINSSVIKLMSEIRSMVAHGQLKFEKFDQDMVIPENIEDQLNSGMATVSAKDLAAHFAAGPTSAPITPSDELNQLRRKIVQLSQENQRLLLDNSILKDKIDQIKKIA